MLRDVEIAVLDLVLPDGFGGDLVDEPRDCSPAAQALVLSASLDYEFFDVGAAGAPARCHADPC